MSIKIETIPVSEINRPFPHDPEQCDVCLEELNKAKKYHEYVSKQIEQT